MVNILQNGITLYLNYQGLINLITLKIWWKKKKIFMDATVGSVHIEGSTLETNKDTKIETLQRHLNVYIL